MCLRVVASNLDPVSDLLTPYPLCDLLDGQSGRPRDRRLLGRWVPICSVAMPVFALANCAILSLGAAGAAGAAGATARATQAAPSLGPLGSLVSAFKGASGALKPVPLGVFLGLAVGKPAGIFLSSWLALKLGLATLPLGMKRAIWASSALGVGFTMHLSASSVSSTRGPRSWRSCVPRPSLRSWLRPSCREWGPSGAGGPRVCTLSLACQGLALSLFQRLSVSLFSASRASPLQLQPLAITQLSACPTAH